MWLGDFPSGFTTVPIFFTTHEASGEPVAPLSAFEAADVRLYKNGSATERTSQAGWTMTSPFDTITGLHRLLIDLSDNTDAGFYAAGSVYTAVLSPDETVDGIAVVKTIGQFGIDLTGTFARLGAPAGASVSADLAAVKADTAAILVDTGTTLDGRIPAALVGGRMDASVGAMAANVITAAAMAADAGAEIADAFLDRDMSTGTDSGSTTVRTPRQALRGIRNKSSIAAGTLTVTKEDDATTSWTAAVTTAAGNPISAIDPAGP